MTLKYMFDDSDKLQIDACNQYYEIIQYANHIKFVNVNLAVLILYTSKCNLIKCVFQTTMYIAWTLLIYCTNDMLFHVTKIMLDHAAYLDAWLRCAH